jgi:hypothetical protein
MRPKQNFNIGLRNGLLDRKHYQAMRGDALWLYSFLLDLQTRRVDKDRLGKVAGGVPISDADIAGTFGCSGKTISRWREKLVRAGYIAARRTSYGYVYGIHRPKKWAPTLTDRTDVSDHPSLTDRTETPTDRTDVSTRSDSSVRNKEEVSRETSSSSSDAAISANQMEGELNTAWEHYLNVFDEDETISPSAKQMGIVVLTKLREKHPAISSQQCVDAMTSAIDRAHKLVKTKPEKAFSAKWHAIFSKFETFYSLWEEA